MRNPLPISVALVLSVALAACGESHDYDIVLEGGRVMDPESGLDAVRIVGILAVTEKLPGD